MSFFLDVIKILGGATALVAATGFLAKLWAQHSLAKKLESYKNELLMGIEGYKAELQADLETHKARLSLENAKSLDSAKFEFEKELILHRGEVDLAREGFRFATESEKQREDRLRAQIQRWALPIQGAIQDLTHRLDDILGNESYLMLTRGHKQGERWSASYAYFMPSTIYYFAQYFCWTRLLQQQLGHELFRSPDEMSSFFRNIEEVSGTISRFPYDPENDDGDMIDRQVFKLQQRAIGELLVESSTTSEKMMTYREFLDKWLDEDNIPFRRHLKPIESFLEDVSPGTDVRWTRLRDLSNLLKSFSTECEQVLQSDISGD